MSLRKRITDADFIVSTREAPKLLQEQKKHVSRNARNRKGKILIVEPRKFDWAARIEAKPEKKKAQNVAHSPQSAIYSVIDPFVKFSFDLSQEDQYLVKSYVLDTPSEVYGISPDGICNPVRDLAFYNTQICPITLSWMLIGVAWNNSIKSKSLMSATTLERRSNVYLTMKKAVGYRDQIDQLVSGLVMATIVESRTAGIETARLHGRGYGKLVKLRGGLENMILTTSSPFSPLCHIVPHMLCNYCDREDLKSPTIRFVEHLHDLWKPRLNTSARKAALLSPILSCFLGADLQLNTYLKKSSFFASLFGMCLGWDASSSAQVDRFFERLVMIIEGSALRKDGKSVLTVAGLCWVVLQACMDVTPATEHARLISQYVDALQVFGGLSDRMNQRLAQIFELALQLEPEVDLKQEDLDDICDEIGILKVDLVLR